jgi:glucose/arabinose dehydrogenase
MPIRIALLIVPAILTTTGCAGQDDPSPPAPTSQHYQATILRDDLQQPWGMTFLPDNQALVTEKSGRLTLIEVPTGNHLAEISGMPVVSVVGQGGLLDVEVDPQFSVTPWVYLSYVVEKDGLYGTEVGRGKLVGTRLEEFTTLFVALPKQSAGHHFGSRLVFDREEHLFITLGDRGERDEAQNLQSHPGSIIRIHKDGSLPADNPFVGPSAARPEIFSYGHRNVQGAALHPQTGELWAHEHGPQGGDEINVVSVGKNYGWPLVTYGKEYVTGFTIGESEREGFEDPRLQWTPSIAPSGMAFYHHKLIPEWEDSLLVGALKFQLLVRLTTADGVKEEERLFEQEFGRIRDVAVDSEGYVYLLTDATDGKLVRIGPGSGQPVDRGD